MLTGGEADTSDDTIGMGLGLGIMILWWITFWTFVIAYIIAFVVVLIYNKKIRNKNILDNIGSLQNLKKCIYVLFSCALLFILMPIIIGLTDGLDIEEFNISNIFIGVTLFAVAFAFIVVFKLQRNQGHEIEKLKKELTLNKEDALNSDTAIAESE
jgi:positive regulator of sigma E activity